MNKVINIELAGQIFWVEERAYKLLESYQTKLKSQLEGREFGDDIFADIKHRLAELLFNLSVSGKRAVSVDNVDEVIRQVGYLDSDELDTITEKKSYRDLRNKILGGVCAGLAKRLSLPVLWVRLAFLALTLTFGVGVIAYIVFWLSLDKDVNRNSYLSAQGRRPTAKLIATVDESRESEAGAAYGVLFVPLRLFGELGAALRAEYAHRQVFYSGLMKVVTAFLLIVVNVLAAQYLLSFASRRLFTLPVNVFVIFSMGMFVISLTASIVQRMLLGFNKIKQKKIIASGISFPALVIITGLVYLESVNSYERMEIVSKHYRLEDKKLQVKFDKGDEYTSYPSDVDVLLRAFPTSDDTLRLTVNYISRGRDAEDALYNIHGITFLYQVIGGVVTLDRYFSLRENDLYRGQAVTVTLEIPSGVEIGLPRAASLERNVDGYYYSFSGRDIDDARQTRYVSGDHYLHDIEFLRGNKPGSNELAVLKEKFCQSFYVGEVWQCNRSIAVPASTSRLLNPVFQSQVEEIERVRAILAGEPVLDQQLLQNIRGPLANIPELKAQGNSLIGYLDYLLSLKSEHAK